MPSPGALAPQCIVTSVDSLGRKCAHALKQAHYYTADESKYASALNALAGKPEGAASPSKALSLGTHANISVGLGQSTGGGFVDSMELSRVIGAIAQHPRHVEEDDDE